MADMMPWSEAYRMYEDKNSYNVSHCTGGCFQNQSVQGHPGKESGVWKCCGVMI